MRRRHFLSRVSGGLAALCGLVGFKRRQPTIVSDGTHDFIDIVGGNHGTMVNGEISDIRIYDRALTKPELKEQDEEAAKGYPNALNWS